MNEIKIELKIRTQLEADDVTQLLDDLFNNRGEPWWATRVISTTQVKQE